MPALFVSLLLKITSFVFETSFLITTNTNLLIRLCLLFHRVQGRPLMIRRRHHFCPLQPILSLGKSVLNRQPSRPWNPCWVRAWSSRQRHEWHAYCPVAPPVSLLQSNQIYLYLQLVFFFFPCYDDPGEGGWINTLIFLKAFDLFSMQKLKRVCLFALNTIFLLFHRVYVNSYWHRKQ